VSLCSFWYAGLPSVCKYGSK